MDTLHRAHICLNPSPKEGWGLTVVEANQCGVPVVASDRPGLRDSVRDGQTGLLVPYGEPRAMEIPDTELEHIANSPYAVIRDTRTGTVYLSGGKLCECKECADERRRTNDPLIYPVFTQFYLPPVTRAFGDNPYKGFQNPI